MQSLNKVIFLFLILFMGNVNAENISGNKWSFYTGMFDFSDEGKKSNLIGIEHINTNKQSRTTSFNGFTSSIKYFVSMNFDKQNDKVMMVATTNTSSIFPKYMFIIIF